MNSLSKKLIAVLLTLGLVLAPTVGLAANRYWWQVVDEQGRPYATQTVRCSVYDVAGTGARTLYTESSLHATTATNLPLLSDANSLFHFWSSATTDVRVKCYADSGGASQDVRLRNTDHRIVIDRQGRRVVRFAFSTNATATNTNVFVPAGAVIRDVIVELVRGGINSHLEVGFRGDHLGAHSYSALVHRLSLQTGDAWLRPHAVTSAQGSGQWPSVVQNHRGVALTLAYHMVAVGDVFQGGSYQPGFYVEKPYVVPTPGVELQYRTSNTLGIGGHVHVLYDLFHVGVSWSPFLR